VFKGSSVSAIRAEAAELASILSQSMLPVLDSKNSVPALNQAVNHGDRVFDITQDPVGSMNAVILAILAGDTDFGGIVERRRSQMDLAPESDHMFNRMVTYLQQC
jgi:hypothetical protein